jgi:hypothetical protein
MKLNKIAAAVALASVATVSQAAWDAGTANGTNGELILTVWNDVTKTSFTQDLGVGTYAAMDIALDSAFTLNAAGLAHVGGAAAAGDLYFNIAGANNNQPEFGATGEAGYWGGYFTQATAPTSDWGTATIGNIWNSIDTYRVKLNSAGVSDGADDPTILLTGAQNYAGNEVAWGTTAAGFSGPNGLGVNSTTASVADSLYGYSFEFTDAFSGDFNVKTPESAGFWAIDLGTGQLKYSAVPVPAAVWLFASGLIGLAGIARRKKS